MAIETVGIVGAGQMGNGIAHVFALAGYDVLLNDISEDGLRKALETIDKNSSGRPPKERFQRPRKQRRWPGSAPR